MKKLMILLLIVFAISSIFAWNHTLFIDFSYPDGIPSGATNMPEPDGNIDRSSGDECSWIQDGMWFAVWISKVSPSYDVSDTFFAGDYEWGYSYTSEGGYFNTSLDNFKTVGRTRPLELAEGDTLHLRFWSANAYDEFLWGLDTVFTSNPNEYGTISIHADMIEISSYRGPWYSLCIPLWKTNQEDLNYLQTPKAFTLAQNTPNPFNATTSIEYSIPEDDDVSLIVYDIDGRKIANLINEHQSAGNYNIKWDGIDDSGNLVATGTYFYKLVAGDYEMQKTMILIK